MGLRAREMGSFVSDNLDDLSVRTLGINFLYVVDPEETLEFTIDPNEVHEVQWVSIKDVLEDKIPLFYNHNLILKGLYTDMIQRHATQGDNK